MVNSPKPGEQLKQNYYGQDIADKSNWYSDVATAYDRVRPRYSDRLVNLALEYTQLPPRANILEIGCNAGIATTSFASRGFNICCLEPNPEACQLARKNCHIYPDVEICQTTLEKWSVTPQKFDAVLAATSIHWVSPEIGYPKIAKALKDNGVLILLWNAGLYPSQKIDSLLQPIYKELAPSLKPTKNRETEKSELTALAHRILDSGYFTNLRMQDFMIEVNYSLEDYLLLLSTYSPYIALETKQRANLFAAIEECLQENWKEHISLSYLSMLQVFCKV